MASRNHSNKKVGPEEATLDKRRRGIGAEKMERQGGAAAAGRARTPFSVVNNRSDLNTMSDVTEVVDFTKEEVEALLNEKKKGNTYDNKKKMEQMTDHIKRLKACVRWYKRKEEEYVRAKEKLRSELEASEKKCNDTETEMKNKIDELKETLTDLRMKISSLEERIVKEESDKLEAINSYSKEKEARIEAEKVRDEKSAELEKVRDEKSVAEKQATFFEDEYNRSQAYNMNLQQYNSSLQFQLETCNEALKRVETEKATIVESLSNVRGHYKAVQDELSSLKVSHSEDIKQNKCLSEKLKQTSDDRDRLLARVHALTEKVAWHEENIGKTCTKLDKLMIKTNVLEETCSSQNDQIHILQKQLFAEKEKLKNADLSASERRIVFEEQKRIIQGLQDRLADKEFQVVEGEKLRKKLHNTILELKGNIRVFCRVRPSLPNDSTGTYTVVSFPTSTEALGRGIELSQSGQKYNFTFDKVFDHEASQRDVFVEISQLVQSALDGYKVCIFAYGQTGAGKTYTMMGRPDAPDLKGLIPRSLEQIFQTSQSLKDQGWKYTMQASILEIYNETVRDLLSSNRSSDHAQTENGTSSKQYTIKHDANGNTHVSDLTIKDVCSADEISSLLQQAAQSRSVGRTQMNEQSSRSHFVFTLRISGKNENTEQQVQGILNLIDLAGSERLSRSGATGDRLKETQAINKSLSSLSDVIFALGGKKEEHIPFRNSKLTYLLQPCLGGDSKTLMFVNISPDQSSTGESLCSLRFAARVNACEIGIPRRQTHTSSTRSSESRLSYG
ncbi:hypothetical protein VNO80_10936 [Phaseolus coccineus]|uniref:Kinesin motor domain-containing protein n=1 Tax=Phaseolus coccineus TaxID=3886 RepID=A0AAN9NFF0_PHACN